jgi:hypothetical protein
VNTSRDNFNLGMDDQTWIRPCWTERCTSVRDFYRLYAASHLKMDCVMAGVGARRGQRARARAKRASFDKRLARSSDRTPINSEGSAENTRLCPGPGTRNLQESGRYGERDRLEWTVGPCHPANRRRRRVQRIFHTKCQGRAVAGAYKSGKNRPSTLAPAGIAGMP